MGSNVSRHSERKLSGRRTQSSGDLSNKYKKSDLHSDCIYYTPNNGKKLTEIGNLPDTNATNGVGATDVTYLAVDDSETGPYTGKSIGKLKMAPQDRYNFCGSLPNNLDEEDGDVNASNTSDNNNHYVEYVTVAPSDHDQLKPEYPVQARNSYKHQKPQIQKIASFSYSENNCTSSTNPCRTFRANNGYDQGYGSERSPEEELPPQLPILSVAYTSSIKQLTNNDQHHNNLQQSEPNGQLQYLQHDYHEFHKYDEFGYSFITPDCCFKVQVKKNARGLGLSVSGGTDTSALFPGLIRIKRLFPHQVCFNTGMLQQGDILLEANKVLLMGLTNYEALEVLRTTSDVVNLIVCRPHDEEYRKLSPPTEAPRPPERSNLHCLPLDSNQTYVCGEFEISMMKQHGSLGFTLLKEDESVLGHCVRALVREPATSDGRLRPGDKIVAVNDVPMCPMSHEEAVIFLRMAPDTVKLRLYRDEAQTPTSATSPSCNETTKTLCNNLKPKMSLRPEAINLLTDIAFRNKKHSTDTEISSSSTRSNNTSPRRLKRGNKSSNDNILHRNQTEKTDYKHSFTTYPSYIVTSQPTSVCSDSDTSNISQYSYFVEQQTVLENSEDGIVFETNEAYSDESNLSMIGDRCDGISCRNNYDSRSSIREGNSMYQTSRDGQSNLDISLTPSLPTGSHDQDTYGSSLLKWKGIMFSSDKENDVESTLNVADDNNSNLMPEDKHPTANIDFDLNGFEKNAYKIFTVELNRGWNSRLGFSLQSGAQGETTFVSAIYHDSVAARDGRLKVGDQLLMVNDESVEGMPTTKVIELLRIIPGSIVLTIRRPDIDNV